eukprot:1670786-Amphidinium_carterae.1
MSLFRQSIGRGTWAGMDVVMYLEVMASTGAWLAQCLVGFPDEVIASLRQIPQHVAAAYGEARSQSDVDELLLARIHDAETRKAASLIIFSKLHPKAETPASSVQHHHHHHHHHHHPDHRHSHHHPDHRHSHHHHHHHPNHHPNHHQHRIESMVLPHEVEHVQLTGHLIGWASKFRARRGVFDAAVRHSARGIKDKCIVHVLSVEDDVVHDVAVELYFDEEKNANRFEMELFQMAENFPGINKCSKLTMKKMMLAEIPPHVRVSDYNPDGDSPTQATPSGSGPTPAASTRETRMRQMLAQQRVCKTGEKDYECMHIVPASMLDDHAHVLCPCWLYLSGSATFHKYFDGPDTAPHIQVSINARLPGDVVGETKFIINVDTSKVDEGTPIDKPDSAEELPRDQIGYTTTVILPESQADNFEHAISWRTQCVEEAWRRKSLGHTIHKQGRHAWFWCVPFGFELQEAISDAKRAVGLLPAHLAVVEQAVVEAMDV